MSRQKTIAIYDFMDRHSATILHKNTIRWGGIWYKLIGQSCPLPTEPTNDR